MTLPLWAAQPQRAPLPGGDSVLDDLITAPAPLPMGVVEALAVRSKAGEAKYGSPLRAFNGRSPEVDYAQEQLDATVYAWQAAMEAPTRRRRWAWRVLSVVAGWSAWAAWWLGGER